jgi:cytochrome c oxidase subunit 2
MTRNSPTSSAGVLERWLLPLVIWSLALVAIAFGVQVWLPKLASEHGAGIDRMLYYLLFAVGTIFVIGNITLGYFVWRFSRAEKVTFRNATRKMERRWSIIPIIIMALVAEGGVFVLGLPVWSKLYTAAPPEDSVVVQVLAEQFAWNIRYAGADGKFGRTKPTLYAYNNPMGLDEEDPAALDDIVTLSRIVLPVNRPVHIRLGSKDVLHSFFLPNHRVKQDAVPGMTISLWFVPTETGEYELACAELCGSGHYTMRGLVGVVTEEEFDEWMKNEIPYLAP